MARVARPTLEKGVEQLGLSLNDVQLEQLKTYSELLTKWNKTINLISRRDMGRLVPRHLLDSLAGLPWITGQTVLDVGSGAGLPGIPLAIALPATEFTLCERMARRARFLGLVARELALENVSVCDDDVRTLPEAAQFSTIVARAVDEPRGLWNLLADRLTLQGTMVVYSHTQESDEARSTSIAGAEVTHHSVRVPGMQFAHTICEIKKQ